MINGWMNEWMSGWTYRWTFELFWINSWNRWLVGQMDEWMDG